MKTYPKFLTSNLLSVLIGASVSMTINLIPEAVDGNPYIWCALLFLLIQISSLFRVFTIRESIDAGVKDYLDDQWASYVKGDSLSPSTPKKIWTNAVNDEKLTFFSVVFPAVLFLLSIVASGFLVKKGYEYNEQSKNKSEEQIELVIHEISTAVEGVELGIEAHVLQSQQSSQAFSDSLRIYNEQLKDANESLKGIRLELRHCCGKSK